MIEQDRAPAKMSPKQIAIIAFAIIVLPIIALLLVVRLVIGIEAENIDKQNPALTDATAVAKRLQPVAEYVAIDPNAPKIERSGEDIVKTTCAACHVSGALGAPKIGDKAAWAKHISEGYEHLVQMAIKGAGQMPPRGGDPSLTDTEVARAVAVMANQSGANFSVPQAKPDATPTPAADKVEPAPAASQVAPAPAKANAGGSTPVPTAVTTKSESTAGASGEAIYKASCAACHTSGVAGAPKLGDKAAWAARIKSGKDTLYHSALQGKPPGMPAKGGNMGLSDSDVKAAVDYLVQSSR